ncbi:MAG: DNA polymerase II large subunit [Promethearchaeota archaeon]
MQECSEEMQEYFNNLETELTRIFNIANKARSIGLDPVSFVEIHPAKDLASRVEVLLAPEGVADRIRYLSKTMDRDEIAFKITEEIVKGKYDVTDINEIAELATRVALSILTGGITAAPLEGISAVRIRENFDRTQYLAIYFAGPIRSAGGTEAALAVLVGDWVRNLLKLDKYKPTQKEVERYIEEIQAYKKTVNLQYPSIPEEIRNAAKNIPIEITGDPTEQVEVSGYRDLKRVGTNQLRGGACLVLNDGIIGKAHKLIKIVKKLNITGWDWLDHLQIKKEPGQKEQKEKIPPKDKFIAKVITGRPVFAYPSRIGGFRVRYGRSRDTGFAAVGLNPATMILLDNFLVPGTQFITERPGKGSIVLPVDSIEGPIVRLKGGEVLQINSVIKAIKFKDKVEKFLYLGDCLIAYGEFLENNHILIPSGYCEEWWCEELRIALEKKYHNLNAAVDDLVISEEKLKKFIENPFSKGPNEKESIILSAKLQIPIYPKYNYFWGSISKQELISLRNWLRTGSFKEKPPSFKLEYNLKMKDLLEKLGIPHKLVNNKIVFTENTKIIKELFALDSEHFEYNPPNKENLWTGKISSFIIRDRAPYYIGGRMGRPEKAKGREFFHVLFPIGIEGGNRRSILKAAEAKRVSVEIVHRECPQCRVKTFLNKCSKCNIRTVLVHKCPQLNCQTRTDDDYCPRCGNITRFYDQREIPLKKLLLNRIKRLNESMPKEIKGVKGLINEKKIAEILEKGILRAKYNIFAYRDGTIRFDATDAPLTHFTPSEVNVSISNLIDLGYKYDYLGKPLKTKKQILEMKVQDIIIPMAGAEFLMKVANFIDDLLTKVYHLESFYNISKKKDLLGHLVIGLAPHISAGVVGRIVGFTTAKLCYAHPYWHSAKRRNCLAGDEEVIIWDQSNKQFIKNSLSEIINSLLSEDVRREVVDDFGTQLIQNPYPNWKVLSIDPQKLTPIFQSIKYWVKGQSNQWVTIRTKKGREITMTMDHNVMVWNPELHSLESKKANQLKMDDYIPVITHFKLPIQKQPSRINILQELAENLPRSPEFQAFKHNVHLRNASRWMRQKLLYYANHYSEEELRDNNIKKVLKIVHHHFDMKMPLKPYKISFGSDWFASIPLSHLETLVEEDVIKWNEIPDDAVLGMARDDHIISPYIEFSEDLMRLFGYYIAKGYIRDEKNCYQTNFSLPNPILRDHVAQLIQSVLGSVPYYNEDSHQLVHTGRIHAYLFAYAWGMGRRALNKRIPCFIFTLPQNYRLKFLSALIDCDGTITHQRSTITLYTGSKKLSDDYNLLLSTLDIIASISKTKGDRYGQKVLNRYRELGKEPKNGMYLYKINIYGKENKTLIHNLSLKHREKQKNLKIMKGISSPSQKNLKRINSELIVDKIVDIEIFNKNDFSYCLEVLIPFKAINKRHNFINSCLMATMNCDGDEDTLILGLDAILNFSRSYLPQKKGGMMDAPLVLTSQLNPSEIDDEVYNMEVIHKFPIEFFERSLKYEDPKAVQEIVDIVEHRIGCKSQFEGLFFTHPTSDINKGPKISRYKELKSVKDKINAQLKLALRTVSADAQDEARRLLHTHFIPDIIGNLRSFSTQKFRCIKCNTKYRRLPLQNKCIQCGGKIILTVTEGGIKKYLSLSLEIAKQYNLDDYTKQRLLLAQDYIDSIFSSDKGRQLKLDKY